VRYLLYHDEKQVEVKKNDSIIYLASVNENKNSGLKRGEKKRNSSKERKSCGKKLFSNEILLERNHKLCK